MDGNSSLERRYSFNMVQHNPVAESTHLNGSSFCWGSSSLLSPKQRSNSSLCLNNTQNDSRIFVTSPHKSRNTTKIDARIVADVQSKGLASRIVKYHETGTRLNRSMSAHNLYSKPGQFPVVNLKKTQLPYRATKHNLSMTRIAPPEKSLFYGKTLSSLLRSNSVVGLQKNNEDLSHENRPILHYPPMENDMAPTRSVLDELKEISRKRINSDDLETTEASKKYCNRGGNDLVDTTGNNTTYVPPHMSAASKSFKRQREINALQQSKQMQELQISPEQAKKRLCNYNNDITSSLSSSNKCKTYERKRPSTYYLNQTMPTNLESYESQRAKIQRYYEEHNNIQADLRYQHLANNSRKEDDIIIKPIAPTVTQEQSFNNGVVPQRTASEPLYKLDDKKTTLNNIQPANKPRLTLFNKNYVVETENPSTNNGQEDDLDDTEGDCAGIQFVKPKKLTTKCGIKNPVLERTNKSKLALMLSGLRGELYQANDMDELDATKTLEKPTIVNEINNDNSKIAQAIKDSQLEATNNTINKGILITTTTSLTTGPTLTTANTTLSTPTKITTAISSSPLVGIKLTPQKTTTAEATKSSETPVKSTVPVLGGFSFGTTNTTLTPTLAITPSTKDSTKESTAETGINKLPQTPLSAAITKTNNTPVLSFGTNLATAKDGAVTNGQFTNNPGSFSIPTTSAIASNGSNTVTTSKPTASFSFGISPLAAVAPNNASTKLDNSATLANSSKPNASFNFGINSTNTPVFAQSASNAATTSTTSAAPTSNTFSFGTNSTNSTAATPLTAAASTTTSAAPALNTFSFGTNSAATPPQQTSAVAVFAAPQQAATTTNNMTTTSFSFGMTSNPQTTNTTNTANGTLSGGFSFGSNTTTQNSTSTGNTLIKPTNSTTPFNFGSSTATGSNNGPSTAMSNNTSSVFNSNNNATAPSVFGATSPPVFGSGPSQTSVFGTPSNNSTTNVFGSANSTSTSIFGAAAASNNPPTFGSNNDNKSTSMFGSNTTTATNNLPTFGSNTDNNSTSVFGNNTPANNASSPFSFGSKAAEKPNNPPAFGSTTENKSISVFGNNTNSNTTSTSPPFSFGAKPIDKPIANNSNSTSSGGFSFGSLAANAKTDNKPSTESAGGFSFGSAAKPLNSSTFSFGSSGNSSLPATNLTNSNNTASFSFGGAAAAVGSSKPNDTSINKTFSFGTSASSSAPQSLPTANNNSSSNIFGSAAGQVSKPASPAFNFGSNTNIQTNAVAPSTNNIFAPPPAVSNMPASPGNRPIRRATRRLQK